MSYSTQNLNNIKIASTAYGITNTNQFVNIPFAEFLEKLKNPNYGDKDGSHFIRTSLTEINGICLPRSDRNTDSLANFLILDCDKRINSDGKEVNGAPDPEKVHNILEKNNISHALYGSFSHYDGNLGNRYRIIIPTNVSYNKEQLPSTIEHVIAKINSGLQNEWLADARENCTWSQGWFYPRKPHGSSIPNLYCEYWNGNAVDVIEPIVLPPSTKIHKREKKFTDSQISPIHAFNQQYPLTDLLIQYGYHKVYTSKEHQKWIRPNSTSGIPGITVNEDKFFSHHNDEFHDGYWHDAFDLMRAHEGLELNDTIIYAAKNTIAPDGRAVDEHNKSLATKKSNSHSNKTSVILHSSILKQLLEKIPNVNFKKIANIDDDKEPKQSHYHVIAIETILETAKKASLGLCRNHDFIYLYNGAYWQLIDRDELKTFLGKAAEKMGISHLLARHHKFKDDLFKQFIASAHLPKPEQPKDSVFINLKNGTFEITPTGNRLKPFDVNDFLTYQLPFDYDTTAKAPQFEKYLKKVLQNEFLQKILSEYLGYIFIRTSVLKLEKTLLLYGSGANGKSVFYEIVRSLLGEQNTSEYSLQSLTDVRGYYRVKIANKLVNYASEINGRLESSFFKLLVSGEPVEARSPGCEPFIMTEYAKLMFNCNELPMDVEHTEAYFRRFLIIPFNVTIPENEQDKQLANKIIDSELSGVFNWVLEGLQRLLSQKQFTDCDIVKQTCAQYEKESDSVALFLEERGYQPSSSTADRIVLQTLYNEYRSFCTDDGGKPVKKSNFKKRLEKSKILIERDNRGLVACVNKTTMVYV